MLSVFVAVVFASSILAQTPVACDGIAFGVGNLSISSTTDSSINLQLLDAGPSHNKAGLPILQTSTEADPEPWLFLTCNSSFMGYINTLDRGPNNTVSFYGYVFFTFAVHEHADCSLSLSITAMSFVRERSDNPLTTSTVWNEHQTETLFKDCAPSLMDPHSFLNIG